MLFKLVFQIDWLDNGRKEGRKEGNVRQGEEMRLSYGSSFIGNFNPSVREVLNVIS